MLLFLVLKPDKTPVPTPFMSMAEAQQAVAEMEPNIVLQARYQIHPITKPEDARQFNVVQREKVTIAKFDGEYVGQAPVEVVEFHS